MCLAVTVVLYSLRANTQESSFVVKMGKLNIIPLINILIGWRIYSQILKINYTSTSNNTQDSIIVLLPLLPSELSKFKMVKIFIKRQEWAEHLEKGLTYSDVKAKSATAWVYLNLTHRHKASMLRFILWIQRSKKMFEWTTTNHILMKD